MFYSQFILAKKGPLGTIWIAAHLERKLRKNQVADTDIGTSVDTIISPDVPIALRLSSHLLLGVVRIYSKKVNYLFDDCSDTLLKVRQAFRSTAVDLPPEESKAPYHSITLPETFDLDDFELPDNELLKGNFDHHVSAREQITLQDTLDDVTLSTSKFGLDERFGDGDAPQIGLDLDEALLANKGEASEHGDPSGFRTVCDGAIEVPATLGADENTVENSEASRAASANYSSIQAPGTPGLLEEPNLPGAQDAFISDDHVDEDNNPDGLTANEIIEKVSVYSGPCQMECDMVHPFVNEDGCQQDMQADDLKENSHLATELMGSMSTFIKEDNCQQGMQEDNCQRDTQEAVLKEIPHSETELMDSLRADEAQRSPSNKQTAASDGSESGLIIQNEICTNDESKTACPDQSETLCGESYVVGINGFASEDDLILKTTTPSIPASDSCIDNVVDTSSYTNLCAPLDKAVDAEVPPKSEPAEVCKKIDNNDNDDSGNIGCQPCSKLDNSGNLSADKREPLLSPSAPVLRASNSHPNSDNLVSFTDLPTEDVGLDSAVNLVTVTNLTSEDFGLHTETAELQNEHGAQNVMEANAGQLIATHGDRDGGHQKAENIMSQDAPLGEKIDNNTNLPSPERMLSAPVEATTKATELVVDSTPQKEAIAEENKLISGKKRSYTESTLTVQSLNSIESPGAAQSKRSTDLIPDDNDLLSSILVGRRSTALKLKPTPPVPETVTPKRPRLAVRVSAHKRKALIDDAMVLHGDNIRQQLLNTEDIRRVRKKAPCTRPEIWMLQKQFSEGEIFGEPIFTGMSWVLINLHREPFDFSKTRILQAESKAHPVEENELVTHVIQTVDQEPVFVENELATHAIQTVDQEPVFEENELVTHAIQTVDQEPVFKRCGLTLGDDQPACPQSPLKTQNQESAEPMTVAGAAEPKDMTRIVEEATYNHSECDATGHTPEVAVDGGKVLAGDESHRSVSLDFELSTSAAPMSQENGSLIDSGMVRSDCLDKLNDATLKSCVPRDTLDQNLDVRLLGPYTTCINDTLEGASGGEVDMTNGEVLNQDQQHRVEGDHFSEKIEGIGSLPTGACILPESLPVHDATIAADTSLEVTYDANGIQVVKGGVSDVNEGEIPASDVRNDERSPTSNDYPSEVQKLGSLEADLNMERPVFVDRETPECQHAHSGIILDATTNVPEHFPSEVQKLGSLEADLNMERPVFVDTEAPECQHAHSGIILDATTNVPEHFPTEEYGDFEGDLAEHDTDFLNVDDDDDEMNEPDDDSMPNTQEAHMLDNSGWSGRTRAVAKYLQVLFNKEVQDGRKVLQMDHLLTGKTRKEASRMFFETLVLKTKDYIHVEQPNAYDNVLIEPRVKLVKSEF